MRNSVFFYLAFIGLSCWDAYSSVPVAKLDEAWLVYDASYRSYVPYLPSGEAPKTLYYSLKPEKFRGDTLQFTANKGLCLYFNYRLIYQNTSSGESRIKIPIRKFSTGVSSDSVILAFFNEKGLSSDQLNAQVMTSGTSATKHSFLPTAFVHVKKRNDSNWSSLLIISVLIVLILLSFSKMVFPENTDFMQLAGLGYSGKTVTSSSFISGLQMVRILVNSICIATFFYFLISHSTAASSTGLFFGTISYWKVVFWSIFIHILKFTYNYICANFSHMTALLQGQNIAFVNLFYVANLALLLLLIACNFSPAIAQWVVHYHIQIIVFYLVIPELLLSLNIIRMSGLRNVYLFSYICTAELLPLFVALKFLP